MPSAKAEDREVRSSAELERKYDVPADAQLPELLISGVARVSEQRQQLLATYYDTPDLRLRSAKVTLRHRTGDDVSGWHLKLPAGGAREELHVQAPDGAVPRELARLVRSISRGVPLRAVAALSTRRDVRTLIDAEDRSLVEVVDDEVEGSLLTEAGSPCLRWREWEAELKDADEPVLDRVERALLSAGALPSDAPSKVGRVLGLRLDGAGQAPWWSGGAAAGPGSEARPSAATVVEGHLREQVAELVLRDPQVRRSVPDSLHKMRVATRRLRSALHTFRPLLDREQTDPLRVELQHLATVLGQERDVEVMHSRVLSLIDVEPDELVLGPVRHRVDTVLGRRGRLAHEGVLRELDGRRYLQLLDRLDALVADPPFTEQAFGRAEKVLPPLVRRSWSTLHRTMKAAERADGPAQDELLHEARKQAKAARYAAEAVAPQFGGPAKRFAAAMEQLQEVLGEHQDGVVTREVLRELGAASSRAGENGFTFGRLHALEQVRAGAAVASWPQVRKQVSKATLRRWLE